MNFFFAHFALHEFFFGIFPTPPITFLMVRPLGVKLRHVDLDLFSMCVKKTPVVALCLTFCCKFLKAYQGYVWELCLSFTSSLAGGFQKKKF